MLIAYWVCSLWLSSAYLNVFPPEPRLSEEANEKKLFLCWGQDAGILEVLPYHECDSVSKDQPDYLTCLLRLQVQHISSRYPVFISGEKFCVTLLSPTAVMGVLEGRLVKRFCENLFTLSVGSYTCLTFGKSTSLISQL